MESCNNQKYIIATLCLDTALHNLDILSTSFTRNAFPIVFKEFPHMLSICWLLFLHSEVQIIQHNLNWFKVR